MATLDWRIEKRLLSYAVAATAAGVGTMACSLPAGAKVVSTSTFVQIPPNIMVNLDLNGDGIPDFQFSNNNNSSGSSSVLRGNLKVLPQNQGNAIWGASAYASALGPGVVVGSNGAFQQGHEFMAHATHFCHSSCLYRSGGPWKEATRLYLGFQFTILGQMHYGWARVSVAATDGGVYAAVTGYAYETVPNVSIVTGQTTGNLKKTQDASKRSSASLGPSASQPASLGLLARGSLGLDAWRRRDAVHTG